MKLIEILARELKEWPEENPIDIGQAADGDIHVPGTSGKFIRHLGVRLTIADDWNLTNVAREEWEAARLALTNPTLETMLAEWRDLEARAQAAQAEADALFEHAGQCHGEIVVRLAELGWGAPRMVQGEPVVTLDNRWVIDGFVAPPDATYFCPENDVEHGAWMKCVDDAWWCLVLGDSKWRQDDLTDDQVAALISRPLTQP